MTDFALIESFNFYLGLGTIALIAVIAILIFDMRVKKELELLVMRFGMLTAFLFATGASVMTLIYSEIFGFTPCGLCWFERIMLYPQVLIIGGAIFFKDNLAPRYGILLSSIGFVISLYHHYLQMGGTEVIRCPTAGPGVSCAERSFFEFGFVTFPLMAAVLFAFLIALYVYLLKVHTIKN